jgi:ferrous-iron efflux pump FieF
MSLADRARTGLSADEAARLKRLATHAAVAAAALMIGLKIWAWLATGSVAMLSSLVDSTLDLIASAINLIAVRHALTPADEEHRFGHGKAEALAGLGQATFVGGSAAFLLLESLDRLILPRPVAETSLGLTVMIACTVITLALVLFQRYVIARTRSLAIGADQLHYTTDLATNAGVIVALLLSGWLGWTLADPLMGLAIAATIGWGAFKIVSGAYHELMDREFDDADRERIKAVVSSHKAVVSLHDLRTRRAGHHAFIQMHLELPPEMTLSEAHRISDEVEEEIRRLFPDAEVLTHLDPAGLEDMKPLDRD